MCLLAKLDEEMHREDWTSYFRERQSTQASLQSLDMFIASRALNPSVPPHKRARFSSLSMHMRRLMHISPFVDINQRARRSERRATSHSTETSIWDIERLSLEDKKDPQQQSVDAEHLHNFIDCIEEYTDIDVYSIELVRDVNPSYRL